VTINAFQNPPITNRDYFRLLALRIGTQPFWRGGLLAVILGALGALAMPPFGILPALIPSLVGLVWLLDGRESLKEALATGWFWGVGHFALGIYWVSYALLVDAEHYGWLVPFAVLGMGGGLGLFTALIAGLTKLLSPSGAKGPGRLLILAGFWTLFEWVRSWIFTGFPWNLTGSIWDASLPMLQFGAVGGIYSLSFLTILAAASPALLIDRTSPALRFGPPLLMAALLGGLFLWGQDRLARHEPSPVVEGVRLRLVQPAIPQTVKWRRDQAEGHLQALIALSQGPGWDKVNFVIWPETAIAFDPTGDAPHRAEISAAAPPGGLLLTGAPRFTDLAGGGYQLWNSLEAWTAEGDLAGSFDKVHLVPFGEYLPLRGILPLDKLAPGRVDFSAGPALATLALPGLPPVGPLICYEAIFPGEVVGKERPDWLLNITNDGWFGLSAGPYQHLAAARMRAIEEGLPLVRVANTGISAIIDPLGRETARLELGERGIVDGLLPRPLAPTLFARFGVWPSLLLAALAILAGRSLIGRRVKLTPL